MRVLHWIPALLLAGLIFFLSSQSDPPGARLAPDYLLHSWGYALFGASLLWGLTAGLRERLARSSLLLAWLLAILYGASDEIHQSFVPGRDPSWFDLTSDTVGAGIGILVLALLLTWRGRRGRV
ncbi:MAG: VanZ family protein [Acidobacteriota bacterium]